MTTIRSCSFSHRGKRYWVRVRRDCVGWWTVHQHRPYAWYSARSLPEAVREIRKYIDKMEDKREWAQPGHAFRWWR